MGFSIFSYILIIAYLITTVRGQLVACRGSSNCTGGQNDFLGMMSPRNCCVNTPRGLAYVINNDSCVRCIVIGFFEDSFSEIERRQPHTVQMGYQKGAEIPRQDLEFDVGYIEDTARKLDFTLNTIIVTLSVYYTESVTVTFHQDGIAQEPDETFNLTLALRVEPTPREGIYLRDTIQMTIIDRDNVEVSFSKDNFQANEALTILPVLVYKTARIASRIELVVIPLTVQEATATSLPLPPNIPAYDQFSPPFANLGDFNSTNITVIFEPDEDAEVNETSVYIPIVDDAINEFTEQVFVAELQLVSSLDSATVDLNTQPSTLCRIIDNDPMRIGFELPGYTYTEPQFETTIDFYVSPTGQPENGPIYLVKKDNMLSEQNFHITIQVMDSAPHGSSFHPATFGVDYRLSRKHFTQLFHTFQQRLPFYFTLLIDDIAEGTEAFQACVSLEDNFQPNLTSSIYIIIKDNDVITIGFINGSYAVGETAGMIQVLVYVFNPPENLVSPTLIIDLVIQTVSGSAIGGSDYQEISAAAHEVLLTFDNANRQQSFNMTILDDSLFELDAENFTLELRFSPFEIPPSNVVLQPNVSTVEILDEDSIVIGFFNTSYTVCESDGVANIQIGVIQGSLERPLVVQFSTSAISAADGSDYSKFARIEFTLTTTIIDAPVALVDDDIFELTEQFGASLTFPEVPPSRVTLASDPAQVTILDDDVLTFGFELVVYDVSETVGSVNLGISFVSGNAREFVPHVNVSTVDGTATGSGIEADYISVAEQSVAFLSAIRFQSLTVQIHSDSFTEFEENFTAVLTSVFLARTAGGVAIELTDQESARLIRDPDIATVNILDSYDEPTKSTGLSTVVAVVMVCAVAFLILLTAVIIVAHACKKKAKRSSSKEQDESIYESISDVFTEPMKCDWTPGNAKQSDENVYDEIQAKTIFENTSLFELMDNKAYSSFKPSAAEATS